MTNENEKLPVEEQATQPQAASTNSVDEFLEAAKQVREGSVSREEYNEIVEANKKLRDFILEGKELPEEGKESTPSIAELQKIRHNPDATNLEIAKASLGIRDIYLQEKGIDLFALKPEEAEFGKKTAEVFKRLVKEANGNPKTFNFLLDQELANDDSALINAIRKRKSA